MRSVLTAMAMAATTASASDVEIKTDRFTGKTTASLVSSKAVDTTGVYLQPATVFAVNRYKNPDGYSVQVAFVGNRWRYLQCNKTYWLVDGKPYPMPAPGIVNQTLRGGVSEFFGFDLTAEQMNDLAQAKTIEFKVCADEYKLKDRGMLDIREINALKL